MRFPMLLAAASPIPVIHLDPVPTLLLALAIILAGARLGGCAAERLGQPAVLGELLVGVVLGNVYGPGLDWIATIRTDGMVSLLAQVGAVILLFEVGLESTM